MEQPLHLEESSAPTPPQSCDTVEWWDEYFRSEWTKNGGNGQTRVFATRFCQETVLRPRKEFGLLDVSCAYGDALPVFKQVWPLAQLHASDFSPEAVVEARNSYGSIADFTVARMEDIRGYRDIIYCSNTLEHFTDYRERARHLVRCCAHLCIIVPYNETRNGKPLQPDPAVQHQATFLADSFDFLLEEGLATRIRTRRHYCRGVWSWTLKGHVKVTVLNQLNRLLGRPLSVCPTMMLFDICSATSTHSCAELGLHKGARRG